MLFSIPFISRMTSHPLLNGTSPLLPSTISHSTANPSARKRGATSLSAACFSSILGLTCVYLIHATGASASIAHTTREVLRRLYISITTYDWRASASFRVTDAMKVSIAMSMALGVLLGIGVGLISGLEPAVVIGVSASMAMGCVFVMSFAIVHGVNALRAVAFALFVSVCLPLGFGLGFGIGILIGVFLGLEDPDDIRETTRDFVVNFGDFLKVTTAFTFEIL